MKKAKKIISRVIAVFSAVIFVVGLLVFISVLRANGGDVPSVLGFSVLRVETGSMEDAYPIGSVIIAKRVDTNTLKTGDVISFYATGEDIYHRVNTHRIVEVQHLTTGELQFITKGDANNNVDEDPVFYKKVIGKVICNLGVFSGSVVQILQNPTVILFAIVLPLVVITFFEAVNLVNLFVKNKEKTEDSGTDASDAEEKN